MGWDAFATRDGKTLKVDWVAFSSKLIDPELRDAFTTAAHTVQESAGTCDGYLRLGGLDISTCGEMLEKATSRDVYGDDWPPEEVEELYVNANWGFDIDEEDRWALESAKAFLKVCAENHLGVTFSW